MNTTKDDDFTFSKVVPTNSEDVLEAKHLATDVGNITIKDGLDQQSNGLVWKDKSLPPKEEKIGSLSYTVTDSSSSKKQSNESSENFKTPDRKPITRTKIPFEKGYSQMDWLKLMRTHPDLAGLKGESNKRLISMDEVKKHRSGYSMWTVLKGRVYNISPYMKFHPGGVDMLIKAVGRDGTLVQQIPCLGQL